MKQRGRVVLLVAIIAIAALVLSGCDPTAFLGVGSLSIGLESSPRILTLVPDLDMDIASYTITGNGPNGSSFTEEEFNGIQYVKAGLVVGDWEIAVDGYNAAGTKVGTVRVELTVRRSQMTSVTVTLRPLDGTGIFNGTLNWTDSQETLIDPQVLMVVRDEDGNDIEGISVPTQLEVSGMTASWSVELPVGWYEVTVGLYEGVPGDGALAVWQGVYVLRIVRSQTTSGILAVPETDTFSIPMTYVAGGTFQMGTPSGWSSNERPVHTVSVDSFYIGTYEITQNIYEDVMETNPSNWKGGQLPVEKVSWYDAVAFANALSRRDGLQEVYTIDGTDVSVDWSKVGYRLPTEAEWEYAARGGNQSQGYTYAGSDTAENVAWYDGNSIDRTHEVGGKAVNELGLYDMSGNVWEWIWDWFGSYSDTEQTNPTGSPSGSERVLRGGCWDNDVSSVRTAHRDPNLPSFQDNNIGVRLVMPAD
jgi:formylglycine-generating enzyme required for sulfatase activity